MKLIKLVTASVVVLIFTTILSAYTFYIVGMAFSMATTPIISLDNVLIAESFAAIGAVIAIIMLAVIALIGVNFGAVEALTDIREDD